jgi:hypothetical protein
MCTKLLPSFMSFYWLGWFVVIHSEDLVDFSVSSGSECECFLSAVPEGILLDYESDDEFDFCSSATSDAMVFDVSTSLVGDPHELAPSGPCPLLASFY